jgi:hypothetical protein
MSGENEKKARRYSGMYVPHYLWWVTLSLHPPYGYVNRWITLSFHPRYNYCFGVDSMFCLK